MSGWQSPRLQREVAAACDGRVYLPPLQAQESRTGMPSLSGDESGNEPELAGHPCSRPPARNGSTSSTTLVVVDGNVVAILTTRRTALPLWEVTSSKAMIAL
jgi:hypothetical protein